MNADYSTTEVPATPEHVLELFHEALCDDCCHPHEITFDTAVSVLAEQWNDTILFWWELARPLNAITGLELPLDEWKPALHPMRERTVGAVCRFVASRMKTRPTIRPWRHIDGDCLPAGAFLTARSILVRYGADPREITPSTRLEPYILSHRLDWLWELRRLAPGKLPVLSVDRWFPFWGCLSGVAIGGGLHMIGSLLGKAGESWHVAGWFFLLATFSLALVLHWLSRKKFEFGDLHTFRDLAYALAGQQPRQRMPLCAS